MVVVNSALTQIFSMTHISEPVQNHGPDPKLRALELHGSSKFHTGLILRISFLTCRISCYLEISH